MKKQIVLALAWLSWTTGQTQEIVKDINAGSEIGILSSKNISFRDRLYFHGVDKPNTAGTLWVSDGSNAGTNPFPGLSLVTDFDFLTHTGKKLFFQGFTFVKALYVTDGTQAGTRNIIGLESIIPTQMARLDSNRILMFIKSQAMLSSPDQLWVSDGSQAGTFKIRDLITSSPNTYMVSEFQGKTLIYDFSNNSKMEPLATDGTISGTRSLLDHLLLNNVDEFSTVTGAFGLDSLMIVTGANTKGGMSTLLLNEKYELVKNLSLPEFNTFNRLQLYRLGNQYLIQSGSHLYAFDSKNSKLEQLTTALIANTDTKTSDGKFYYYIKETNLQNFLGVTDGTPAGTKKVSGWQTTVLSETNIQILGDYIYFLTENSSQIKEIFTFHKDSLTARKFSDFGGRFRPTVMNTIPNHLIFSRYTPELGVELYKLRVEGPSGYIPTPFVQDLIIYPNPAKDELTLRLNKAIRQGSILKIMDLQGRELHTRILEPAGTGEIVIKLHSMPTGQYLLQLVSGQETFTSQLHIR